MAKLSASVIKRLEAEQQHHFYATTCYGWAVAPTRALAVERCARYVGDSIIKRAVKGESGGVLVTSVRVNTPQSQHYSINHYLPSRLLVDGVETDRVPIADRQQALLVTATGRVLPED